MGNNRRSFLKKTAIAGIGLGTYPSLVKAAEITSMGMAAGGTQAADLQRGKTDASESAPGDRHPSINQVYPPEAFHHAGKSGRILDVTKPPFNARGDGVTDDTEALIAALRFVRDNYEIHQGDDYTYCTKRHDRNWVVYLPDGEYLISDTVSQGWPALAMNILKGWSQVEFFRVASPEHERQLNNDHPAAKNSDDGHVRGQYGDANLYAENNWMLRVIGQSRDKTIIRLKDNAPGFGVGADKAVLAFYLLQVGSNVNLGNFCENLTIDTGSGNPGAVGLKWNSSNWGGVRNLSIRSGDGAGRAGLLSDVNNATGYLRDLCITGFDTGIEISAGRETMVTLEYATLSGQRETAIRLGEARSGAGGDPLSARKLLVENAPVVLHVGQAGQAIVLESEFRAASEQDVAMDVEPDGFLLARDLRIQGYRAAVRHRGTITAGAGNIAEYATAAVVAFDDEPPLRLPVKDSPLILPETDIAQWANVDDFGAVGDGIADDTAAIQRAVDSGKPVICFPHASYVINGTVDIPASVREITMLFGVITRSQATAFDGPAMFRVSEPSTKPLLIHQAMSAGGALVDHAADRPLVIEDMFMEFNHTRNYSAKPGMNYPSATPQDTEIWRLYRNTRPEGPPKEVFVNGSIGFSSDNEAGTLALENVRVWARMINTEHVSANYSFRRSDAWIFGFKSENADTLLKATDGSRVEVLGGSFLLWTNRRGPVIDNGDSAIAAVHLQWYWGAAPSTIFRNQQAGVTAALTKTQFERLEKVDAAFIRVSSSNRRKPD
ncbi:MAG: twin-arginine translocation signal domain-containing protein [Planctomycetaceae bacterium]|nr:MAG: twin-arginine translocation signal domain-containing protein [Planctomycetaceae bacterium]